MFCSVLPLFSVKQQWSESVQKMFVLQSGWVACKLFDYATHPSTHAHEYMHAYAHRNEHPSSGGIFILSSPHHNIHRGKACAMGWKSFWRMTWDFTSYCKTTTVLKHSPTSVRDKGLPNHTLNSLVNNIAVKISIFFSQNVSHQKCILFPGRGTSAAFYDPVMAELRDVSLLWYVPL